MISTLIIEDEFYSQQLLKSLIKEFFSELEVIGVADNVESAIKLIDKLQPMLVFSDVKINNGTGLDVVRHFKKRNFECIFITAHDKYALEAIKAEAVDYVLKPIKSIDFRQSVNKAIKRIQQNQKLARLNANAILVVPAAKGFTNVHIHDIIFLRASGSYTYIKLHDKELLSTENIGELEKKIHSEILLRCHNSYVVNVEKIKNFEFHRSGLLTLQNGDKIPVSQRKMSEFKKLMKQKLNQYPENQAPHRPS